MSTRLRPIVMISSSIRAGGNARLALESTANVMKVKIPPRGSMPEDRRLITIFQSIPWDKFTGPNWLWLFREPRNTSARHSRYMQLCQYYGIGPFLRRKEAVPEPVFLERTRAQIAVEEARQAIRRRRQEQIVEDFAGQLAQQQTAAPMLNQQLSGLTADGTSAYRFRWEPVMTVPGSWRQEEQ